MVYIDGHSYYKDTDEQTDDVYCDRCGYSWEVPEGHFPAYCINCNTPSDEE